MAEFTDQFAANGGIAGLMEALAMNGQMQQRVCVVVGVTGDGKSTTCNTLSATDVFAVSDGFSSATRGAAHADYLLINESGASEVRIVDTIGLHDTTLPAEEVMKRFASFADLVPQGIDLFLFVARYGRWKPEHEAALSAFIANVGEEALKNTLLVFTGCGLTATQLSSALANAPPSLQEILPKMAGAPVGIDNVADRTAARTTLHAAISATMASITGGPYTNAALAEARARYDVKQEEERAAFAAAVADWRKGTGPVLVVREPGVEG